VALSEVPASSGVMPSRTRSRSLGPRNTTAPNTSHKMPNGLSMKRSSLPAHGITRTSRRCTCETGTLNGSGDGLASPLVVIIPLAIFTTRCVTVGG